MTNELPDFSDQSVAFYVTTTGSMPDWIGDGVILHSPIFQLQGDRLFVVGRTPKFRGDEGEWSADRTAALAWDSVVHYIIVPTDEYTSLGNAQEDTTADETPIKKATDHKLAAKTSLVLIGLIIPTAVLVGLIVWIVKMLINW